MKPAEESYRGYSYSSLAGQKRRKPKSLIKILAFADIPGCLFGSEGKKTDDSGPLDGAGHQPLVFGAIAGAADRQYFPGGIDVFSEQDHVFIVNLFHIVRAEIAGLGFNGGVIIRHIFDNLLSD